MIEVNKLLKNLTLALVAVLVLGSMALADVLPSPYWTNFRDSMATLNGQPVPVGTVIDAYDPDGVHCGTFTVNTTGIWGFMSVYGDDPSTPGVDEGAVLGDTISFKINGRDATIDAGDPTWQDMAVRTVQLSATSTVAIAGVTYPPDTLINPGHTIRLFVTVRNDGDATDFYSVSVTSPDPNWQVEPQDSVSYALAGAEATVYFDVTASLWNQGYPPYNTISYSVYSNSDTTVKVDSSVYVEKYGTDVGDDPSDLLPGTFALQQNFPNPFNPTTTISFTLASRSRVTLEIFDLLGRQVDRIDVGELAAGENHQVQYDASGLASGVYLYRISTDTFADSKKMMLLK